MTRVETDTLRQPFERNPAVNGSIRWRATMEKMRSSGHVKGLARMHWFNHMAEYRQELTPPDPAVDPATRWLCIQWNAIKEAS